MGRQGAAEKGLRAKVARSVEVWRRGRRVEARFPLDASLLNTSPQVIAAFGWHLNHRPAETVAEPELYGEGKALSCMRCRSLLGR